MKYRKKPVVIEAEEYKPGMEDGIASLNAALTHGLDVWAYNITKTIEENGVPYIENLEGYQFISEGDIIITRGDGERYPCKPDIFRETYELVEEGTKKDETT